MKKIYLDADNMCPNPKGGGDIIKSEKLKGIHDKEYSMCVKVGQKIPSLA